MFRNPLSRAIGMVVGYLFTLWLVRLIFLTFIAFSFVRSPERAALQKIGDVVRANQVITYGTAALVFVLALQVLQPLTRTSFRQVFDLQLLAQRFAPNGLNGLIFAAVLVLGTTLGGHMSYLGFYMKFDEVVLTLTSAGLFALFLSVMVLVEEYVLRAVLEPRIGDSFGAFATLGISTAAFIGIKYLQFDLGWAEVLNLALLNLTLSIIARAEGGYMSSASFCAVFLILVHLVFGLPFMGQDMPGILLLRSSADEGLGTLLSGGAAGPESGLVLTVLLLIYLYLPQIRSKKIEV